MEKLSDLPPMESKPTEQESEVMKKYFGGTAEENSSKQVTWSQTFKLAIYATLLFLLLCNPLTDGIFCRLPYCGEGVVTLMAAKTLLFLIAFVCIYRYVV